jgi:hypothetical protein
VLLRIEHLTAPLTIGEPLPPMHQEVPEGQTRKWRTVRLQEGPEPCPTDANCVHYKTSQGDWCIARGSLVRL